jgi:Flp pilus assembly protein TadD
MRGVHSIFRRVAGCLLGCAGAAVASAPVAAQSSYSPYAETASGALARYVRTLASDPHDFTALIGAGRAALALGDAQAAAGFFARADEVNPRSPLPQAGMGAVSVANGEPQAALPYFTRAQQLGGTVATFGTDRGLAYDLLGRQSDAQADYRAALAGPDADEARRRLALSLAISGDKTGALQIIAPLLARRDTACSRVRALVLALSGDSSGAMVALDAAMPGSSARVAPFLQRLPTLQAGQKAAAVNLGIFPDPGGTAYAYAAPAPSRSVSPTNASNSLSTDRLGGANDLRPPAAAPSLPQPSWQPTPANKQIAYATPRPAVQPQRSAIQQAAPAGSGKIWLQLASGQNEQSLPSQFQRMKARHRDIFEGINGFVAKGSDRARLVIGPFRSSDDADTFAEDLESVDVPAFKWSNSPLDSIVPLGSE